MLHAVQLYFVNKQKDLEPDILTNTRQFKQNSVNNLKKERIKSCKKNMI